MSDTSTPDDSPTLFDADTAAPIGPATPDQVDASTSAPFGIILVDDTTGDVLDVSADQLVYQHARRVYVV